ncbi:MAG: dTDP-glucose 4,6-dehydratase [Chlorobi bacterium]|nr:dTDP-glucose 4,6-dehydratase [Chlorobiota bacterium]
MNVVVTGGCGFIGSNLIHHLIDRHPDWTVTNIDSLTYAADERNLDGLEGEERYRFRKLDITDRGAVRALLAEARPGAIIHLAAESHVDNSIKGPEQFIMTNVVGTFNLLEEARQLWAGDPSPRFIHVSTDEVYGALGDEGAFNEETPYAPNSPYSASKAGSDHLARAWHHTYGMNVMITNCSNNYGPRQHREKLIPTVISTALAHRPIPIYGQGLNVRDWLYVADHCNAIDLVLASGRPGESYVVGGRNEWRNIDLVRLLCRLLDEEVGDGPEGGYASLMTFVTDRLGHDARYAIDATKMETELGWRAATAFEEGLRRTVRWYCRQILPERERTMPGERTS